MRHDIAINIDGQFESIFIEIEEQSHIAIAREIQRVPNTNEAGCIKRYQTIVSQLEHLNNDTPLASEQNIDYFKVDTNTNSSIYLRMRVFCQLSESQHLYVTIHPHSLIT